MGKPNNEADIPNANKGVPGQNKRHAHNEGNRGKQLATTPNNANRNKGGKKK
jgi:hypothetical protein